MPIFEYTCDDCGTKFEKLVRRSAENGAVDCPSCGQHKVTKEYSTFAPRADSGSKSAPAGGCGNGVCETGPCGGGMCGMN